MTPTERLRILLLYEASRLTERVQDLSPAEHTALRQLLLDRLAQAPLHPNEMVLLRALEIAG